VRDLDKASSPAAFPGLDLTVAARVRTLGRIHLIGVVFDARFESCEEFFPVDTKKKGVPKIVTK
jgi:hypothetical protein